MTISPRHQDLKLFLDDKSSAAFNKLATQNVANIPELSALARKVDVKFSFDHAILNGLPQMQSYLTVLNASMILATYAMQLAKMSGATDAEIELVRGKIVTSIGDYLSPDQTEGLPFQIPEVAEVAFGERVVSPALQEVVEMHERMRASECAALAKKRDFIVDEIEGHRRAIDIAQKKANSFSASAEKRFKTQMLRKIASVEQKLGEQQDDVDAVKEMISELVGLETELNQGAPANAKAREALDTIERLNAEITRKERRIEDIERILAESGAVEQYALPLEEQILQDGLSQLQQQFPGAAVEEVGAPADMFTHK